MNPLAALLTPYRWWLREFDDDPDLDWDEFGWRFTDLPPDVADRALDLVEDWHRTYRPNGQPPPGWLVEQARRAGGLVVGHVAPATPHLRIDGIQVPVERARDLISDIAARFPPQGALPGPVELAEAEAWPAWDATEPTWHGPASEILRSLPAAAVVGLWWD